MADMESVSKRRVLEDETSRKKREVTLIISSIVIFSIIIGSIITVFVILKKDIQSEALSANPQKAIQEVCYLTPYPGSCSDPIWQLQRINPSKTINPSRILVLSLHVAFKELSNLISTTQKVISKAKDSITLSALKDCESLFNDSIRLLKMSITKMDSDSDENIFKEKKNIVDLEDRMLNATKNMNRCMNGMADSRLKTPGNKDEMIVKMETYAAQQYMENSLTILVQMDTVLHMFDPTSQSVLATLLLNIREFTFSLIVFGSQYLFLVVLLCLIRLFKVF